MYTLSLISFAALTVCASALPENLAKRGYWKGTTEENTKFCRKFKSYAQSNGGLSEPEAYCSVFLSVPAVTQTKTERNVVYVAAKIRMKRVGTDEWTAPRLPGSRPRATRSLSTAEKPRLRRHSRLNRDARAESKSADHRQHSFPGDDHVRADIPYRFTNSANPAIGPSPSKKQMPRPRRLSRRNARATFAMATTFQATIGSQLLRVSRATHQQLPTRSLATAPTTSAMLHQLHLPHSLLCQTMHPFLPPAAAFPSTYRPRERQPLLKRRRQTLVLLG